MVDPFDEIEVGQSIDVHGRDVYKLEIPDWALPYIVNQDDGGLEDDEKELADSWMEHNGVEFVETTGESHYSSDPEFGEPCNVTVCKVTLKQEK